MEKEHVGDIVAKKNIVNTPAVTAFLVLEELMVRIAAASAPVGAPLKIVLEERVTLQKIVMIVIVKNVIPQPVMEVQVAQHAVVAPNVPMDVLEQQQQVEIASHVLSFLINIVLRIRGVLKIALVLVYAVMDMIVSEIYLPLQILPSQQLLQHQN